MSSLVFPTMAGLDIAIKRTPVYATKVQTASSGKELRASFQSTPRFRYSLPLNFLRQAVLNMDGDEAAQLLAFFGAHKGKWDSFWLPDAMAVNLIPNGTSEEPNPTGFGAGYITTGGAYAGSKCRLVVSPSGIWIWAPFTGMIPCVPGETFSYQGVIGGNVSTSQAHLAAYFYNISGTYLATTVGFLKTGTGWTQDAYMATAPANSAFVVFGTEVSGNPNDSALIDNMFACRMSTAGLIAIPDGALTQVIASADGIYMQLQRKVRFDTDEIDFDRFLAQVWEAKSLPFISVK